MSWLRQRRVSTEISVMSARWKDVESLDAGHSPYDRGLRNLSVGNQSKRFEAPNNAVHHGSQSGAVWELCRETVNHPATCLSDRSNSG